MTTPTPGRTNPPRGGNGKFTKNPDTAERDADACRLRRDGCTYDHIAAELGYADRGDAYKGVQRALVAIVQEAAEEVRAVELDRLDMLWRAGLKVLRAKHVTVSNGKVIYLRDDQGNETPLLDDAPVLNAIDRLLRIMERRAKLLGLDAPKRIEVLTMDVIDAEIARLSELVGAMPELPA
jgi:hypothetical protein